MIPPALVASRLRVKPRHLAAWRNGEGECPWGNLDAHRIGGRIVYDENQVEAVRKIRQQADALRAKQGPPVFHMPFFKKKRSKDYEKEKKANAEKVGKKDKTK